MYAYVRHSFLVLPIVSLVAFGGCGEKPTATARAPTMVTVENPSGVVQPSVQPPEDPRIRELHQAVLHEDCEKVEGLLDHGAPIDALLYEGEHRERAHTPLCAAVSTGSADMVKLLLKRGADPNAFNFPTFIGPLHIAAQMGDAQLATLLLEAGAHPREEAKQGVSPMGLAISAGSCDTVAALLDGGADVDGEGASRRPLISAAQSSNCDIAALLLDRGAKIDAPHWDGDTALHCAAVWGDLEMVKLLGERGADINARNNDGETPLALALERDHAELAAALRRLGAKG